MFPSNLTKEYPEVTTFLTSALLKSKLANSYVFIGKDDIANLEIACNLSKILNCKENSKTLNPPCEKCINCNWLEKKEHPQALIIVNPTESSKKEQIKIDSIRELLNTIMITSEFFRVIFFPSSNLLSLPPESCNLLLKIVEEAPERTIFIFANTTRSGILPTILSRSQTIYVTKKLDSISEAITNKVTQLTDDFTSCFSNNLQTALEKAKKLQEEIKKNKDDLKDYLTSLAVSNYETQKYEGQKQFCLLYKNLNTAYSKHRCFMQSKIVIEDFYLECVNSI